MKIGFLKFGNRSDSLFVDFQGAIFFCSAKLGKVKNLKFGIFLRHICTKYLESFKKLVAVVLEIDRGDHFLGCDLGPSNEPI